MNLEIHRPEIMQTVNAHMKAGRFHDADDLIEKALDALDERSLSAPREETSADTAKEPFWQSFTRELHALPDTVFERLPVDGASEHDHYLYGAPKRNT